MSQRTIALPFSSVTSLLAPAFPGTMPASSTFTAASVVMCVVLCILTVSQAPHHLMVLVAQHPRQEKGGFVCASCFKASPWPTFAVNGNVPLAFGAGSPLVAAASPWWQWLLSGVVAGRIGVVPQLMNPLYKLTLFVEHFLGR